MHALRLALTNALWRSRLPLCWPRGVALLRVLLQAWLLSTWRLPLQNSHAMLETSRLASRADVSIGPSSLPDSVQDIELRCNSAVDVRVPPGMPHTCAHRWCVQAGRASHNEQIRISHIDAFI